MKIQINKKFIIFTPRIEEERVHLSIIYRKSHENENFFSKQDAASLYFYRANFFKCIDRLSKEYQINVIDNFRLELIRAKIEDLC